MVVPMQQVIPNSDLTNSYQFTDFEDDNSWDLTNALTHYYEKNGKKNEIYINRMALSQ